MAAKILAACNLQQEPGAVSWYVPVVVDQSVQVKTCYLHSVHSFNSWKTAALDDLRTGKPAFHRDGSNKRMKEITGVS